MNRTRSILAALVLVIALMPAMGATGQEAPVDALPDAPSPESDPALCPARAQDDAGTGGDGPDAEADAVALERGLHAGCVGLQDDSDWYRFQLSWGETLRVTSGSNDGLDLELRLTDCHGENLDVSDGLPWNNDTMEHLTDENTEVCLQTFAFAGSGTYWFEASHADGCEQDDAGSGRDAVKEDPVAITYGEFSGCLHELSGQVGNTRYRLPDEDYFALDLAAGDTAVVVVDRELPGDGRLAAWDPAGDLITDDNVPWYDEKARFTINWAARATGTYTVMARGWNSPYDLTVRAGVPACAPQDDAGSGADAGETASGALAISPGAHTGCLDETDLTDRLRVPVSTGDLVEVEATLDNEVPWLLSLYGDGGDRLDTDGSGYTKAFQTTHRVMALATADGHIDVQLDVERWGGNYTIDVQRTATAATAATALTEEVLRPNGLGHCDDGLRVAGYRSVWHVAPNGTVSKLRDDTTWGGPAYLACDGEGRMFTGVGNYMDAFTIGHGVDGEPMARVAAGWYALALDPTGALWTRDRTHLRALDCTDRSVRVEAPLDSIGDVRDLAFSPDGALYAVVGDRVVRLDTATGLPVAEVASIMGLRDIVFDDAGAGYAVTRQGVIFQFDPATGATTAMGAAPSGGRDLAFSQGRLYITYDGIRTGADGIAYLDIASGGFHGFKPTCNPVVPDLAITSVAVETIPYDVARVGVPALSQEVGVTIPSPLSKSVNVTITNVGNTTFQSQSLHVHMAAGPTNCRLPDNVGRCGTWTREVSEYAWLGDDLAPGESTLVTLEWFHWSGLGDHDVQVTFQALPQYGDTDADPGNNQRTERSHAHVGGFGGFN